ncbi:MAG: collagenase-like protease, partial [Epsilonproteobacteria bacterium]|nr:collagenase-like protease [Campylobacterota bacterium]
MSNVELLSPAGNFEKLKIALSYGADAVYAGVSHFSLRIRSGKEFT